MLQEGKLDYNIESTDMHRAHVDISVVIINI